MQLRTVMRNMARMWRSSLIVFVIAAIVLGALSYALAKPKYRVEGDVLFSSQAFHAFDTPDAAATYTTSLVTTYGTYAKSASLLDEVGQSVSPQIDGATLQQAVVISTAPMMVSVSFMDSDKDRATAVVKAITDSLQEQVKKSAPDVDGKPALSVANSSVITTQVADSAPSVKRSALIGVLGGLVLALLVLLVRALASTRIGDVADLADVTDSSILGVIPRKGSAAQGGGELEAVLGRNLSFIPPKDGLRTVLLAPSLANEDASTVTLAAADRLHADGHSVVVVDADLRRATATKAAGVTSSAGLSDLLAGRATLQQATYDRSRRHHRGQCCRAARHRDLCTDPGRVGARVRHRSAGGSPPTGLHRFLGHCGPGGLRRTSGAVGHSATLAAAADAGILGTVPGACRRLGTHRREGVGTRPTDGWRR